MGEVLDSWMEVSVLLLDDVGAPWLEAVVL